MYAHVRKCVHCVQIVSVPLNYVHVYTNQNMTVLVYLSAVSVDILVVLLL